MLTVVSTGKKKKKKAAPSKTSINAVNLSRATDLAMNLPKQREESKKVKWIIRNNYLVYYVQYLLCIYYVFTMYLRYAIFTVYLLCIIYCIIL